MAAGLLGRKDGRDGKLMTQPAEGVDTIKRDADVLTKFIVCESDVGGPGRRRYRARADDEAWRRRFWDWLPGDDQRARFLRVGWTERVSLIVLRGGCNALG